MAAGVQGAWMIPNENGNGDELAHLQRLYRICEGDRRAYCSNTKVTLLKQRKIILKLESEKAEVRHTLDKLEGYKERVIKDKNVNALLNAYQEQKQRLADNKLKVDEQKDEIHRLEEKIARERCAQQTAVHPRVEQGHDSKRVPNLEDRLENAFVHLNRLLHRNANLRTHIEHLVQQKNMHKFIRKQLRETLSQHKDRIEEAMLTANETYNRRDDAYQKMQALRSTRDHEHQVCGAMLQEARRNVQQHRKFVDFVTAKHRKRARRTGSGACKKEGSSSEEERASADAKDPNDQQQQQKRQWDKAKVMANFELFTYCSNLNNKVKSFQKAHKSLKSKLSLCDQSERDKEVKRKEEELKAEAELSQVEAELQEAEAKLSGVLIMLRKLKAGIENMLYLVGGDNAAGRPPAARREETDEEMMEEQQHGGVSEAALKALLQDIEDQVNVLLQTRRFMDINEQQIKDQERTLSSTKTTVASASTVKSAFFHPDRADEGGGEDINVLTLPIIPSLG